MSDKIDEILEELDEKIDDKDNITMEVVDEAEKDLKKVKEATEGEKKRVRRKIKKIKKIIGQDTPATEPAGKKKKAKAVGTGGGNPGGIRCYIRYNNQGNPYRTCNDKVGLDKPKKPSVITPSIPADEFAKKLGGYSNLSIGQRSEYHRLFMREKREKERELSGDTDAGVEAYRIMRLKEKQEKAKKKEEAIQERLDNQIKYKEELAKLGADPNPKSILKLKKKYNIPLRIRKPKNLKKDIKDEKEEQKDIEKEIKEHNDKLRKRKDVEIKKDPKTGKEKILYVMDLS